MARVNDRWIEKILALPLFDEAFKKSIAKTPLASMAFVLAMDVESSGEFVERVFGWSAVWEDEVRESLRDRVLMLEQFWPIRKATEKIHKHSF